MKQVVISSQEMLWGQTGFNRLTHLRNRVNLFKIDSILSKMFILRKIWSRPKMAKAVSTWTHITLRNTTWAVSRYPESWESRLWMLVCSNKISPIQKPGHRTFPARPRWPKLPFLNAGKTKSKLTRPMISIMTEPLEQENSSLLADLTATRTACWRKMSAENVFRRSKMAMKILSCSELMQVVAQERAKDLANESSVSEFNRLTESWLKMETLAYSMNSRGKRTQIKSDHSHN